MEEEELYNIDPMLDEVGEALGFVHGLHIPEDVRGQVTHKLWKLFTEVRLYNVEPLQFSDALQNILNPITQKDLSEAVTEKKTLKQQCEAFKGKMFKTGHRMDRPYMVVDLTVKGVVLDQWDFTVGTRTRENSHRIRWMTFKEFLSEVEGDKLKLLTTREQIEAQSTQIRWRIRLIEEKMQPMAEEIEALRQQFRQLGFS